MTQSVPVEAVNVDLKTEDKNKSRFKKKLYFFNKYKPQFKNLVLFFFLKNSYLKKFNLQSLMTGSK